MLGLNLRSGGYWREPPTAHYFSVESLPHRCAKMLLVRDGGNAAPTAYNRSLTTSFAAIGPGPFGRSLMSEVAASPRGAEPSLKQPFAAGAAFDRSPMAQ